MSRIVGSALAVSIFGVVGLGAAATAPPIAVSPGSIDAFAPIATVCPTFSWTAAKNATGYELLVYELAEIDNGRRRGAPTDLGGQLAGHTEPPAISRRIEGPALAWTPSTEDCLAFAGSYAWSVRALFDTHEGSWSEATLFEVVPDPLVESIGKVLEGALSRYLNQRGVAFSPDGGFAEILAEELAAVDAPAVETPFPDPRQRRMRSSGGRELRLGEPFPRGVFVSDDVELWLEESSSGEADKVQLVFATPEFDGDPTFGDAWSIVVDAHDSAHPDDGTMFFNTPSFTDALQLFTDGSSTLLELRELTLRRLSSPPNACTFGQEGMFYWDEEANTLCVCDGTGWAPIDSDHTGTCS